MKTKNLILSGAVLMIAASLVFSGCRKPENEDKDTSSAEDNSLADKSFEDMGQISNEAASSTNGSLGSFKYENDGLLSACATVTKDSVNKKITVDFGTANCLCADGRYRRGKIFISYTGNTYWDSLASVTITTTNPADQSNTYFVNDNQVIGTKNVTNKGHNSAHHMNWDVVVNGKVIKANSQGTVTWTSNRNREWLQGETTPLLWSDDVYGVTGSASGTSVNGNPFNVLITSQLIRKVACAKHFVSGTLDFTPGSKPVRHVDFSPPNNGACDNVATVTINSHTYTVYMK